MSHTTFSPLPGLASALTTAQYVIAERQVLRQRIDVGPKVGKQKKLSLI